MTKRITYKIYSDIIRQQTTTIDLTDISNPNIYNHVNEVLRERFSEYNVKINHAGKTIKVDLEE